MTVYSVYEPPGGDETDAAARADKVAFVKDGFSWLAFLIPALWLIFQRMWLELIAFLVVIGVVSWAFGSAPEARALAGWVTFALTLLFAFEANDLRGWALRRRGYRFAGVASGRDRYEAERSFFEAWLPQQQGRSLPLVAPAQKSLVPKGPKPKRRGEGDEVIGLFPQA